MSYSRYERVVRQLLLAVCITGVVFCAIYANLEAYDRIYSSLVPKTWTDYTASPDEDRETAPDPAAAPLFVRSSEPTDGTKKKRTIGFVVSASIAIFVFAWAAISGCIAALSKERKLWLRLMTLNPLSRPIANSFEIVEAPRPGTPVTISPEDIASVIETVPPWPSIAEVLYSKEEESIQDSSLRRGGQAMKANLGESSSAAINDAAESTSAAVNNPVDAMKTSTDGAC